MAMTFKFNGFNLEFNREESKNLPAEHHKLSLDSIEYTIDEPLAEVIANQGKILEAFMGAFKAIKAVKNENEKSFSVEFNSKE